jgi:hypothetical protein
MGYANRGSFVIAKGGRIARKVVTNPTDVATPTATSTPWRPVRNRLTPSPVGRPPPAAGAFRSAGDLTRSPP